MMRSLLALAVLCLSPCLLTFLPVPCSAAEPHVDIVGHRGASHDAPENTLRSLKLGWEQGADGCEFDIHLTSDGVIVASHDDNLKKTAGLDRKIAGMTYAELSQVDVGSWKGPDFQGERIPTFAEILKIVPKGRKIYIEVKCGPQVVPEMNRQLQAAGLPPELTPVICFQAPVIAAVKELRPDLPAYLLSDLKKNKTAEQLIAAARQVHADGLDLKAGPELTAEFAQAVREAGLRLDVWTVNDPALARRMVSIGVQGITTDRPAWLREQLEAR